jgi:hypothetical protein
LSRKVRARMRKAGAFHSYSGLDAMHAQVLTDDLWISTVKDTLSSLIHLLRPGPAGEFPDVAFHG